MSRPLTRLGALWMIERIGFDQPQLRRLAQHWDLSGHWNEHATWNPEDFRDHVHDIAPEHGTSDLTMPDAWDLLPMPGLPLVGCNSEVHHTGGGCMALLYPLGKGGAHLLVTDSSGVDYPRLDTPVDESCAIGVYNDAGDWLGEACIEVPAHKLAETIRVLLAALAMVQK